MTLRIALTGGIGSGKTTVARLFSEHDIPIIDADQIAHDLTQPKQPALDKIVSHFGPDVLDNHSLNRSALRQRIFENADEKRWLEALLHPLIIHEMEKQTQQLNNSYCLLAIPLLAESKPFNFIDRVLLVDCPEELQVERVKARNSMSDTEIRAILKAQATREERITMANDVIINDAGLSKLKAQVDQLHQRYLNLSNLMPLR